jgi:hypothetical protein
MKITALMAMVVAVIGSPALTAQRPQPPVTVCMTDGPAPGWVAVEARSRASQMFSQIGVAIQWRCGGSRPRNITVRITEATSPGFRPDALAYAEPFQNHIQVLYNRIEAAAPASVAPAVLAHVLVHEITHVLEDVSHHSGTGIMKAQWNSDDYHIMASHPLPFAAVDVELIRSGIDVRSARLLAASHP